MKEFDSHHLRLAVEASADSEGHLLCNSAAMDVVGTNLDEFDVDFRSEVLAHRQRLDSPQTSPPTSRNRPHANLEVPPPA